MNFADKDQDQDCFEVILCFKNNTWSFSTYTPTFEIKAALLQAEDEFLIHSSLHDIQLLEACSACVLTGFGRHFFAKKNGNWLLAPRFEVSTAARNSIAFEAKGLWKRSSHAEAVF